LRIIEMRLLNWENIVSGLVGAVLLSLIMWLFGFIGKIPNVRIPKGAIVAFDGECPNEEWKEGTWNRSLQDTYSY
jgi:hypothetical protein